MRRRWSGFYFITDSGLSRKGIIADVKDALAAGAVMVQYREKVKGYPERRKEALEIQALCREAKTPFIVNDDVELARDIGADGVHVGQSDMALSEARKLLGSNAIIGVSVGSVDEARLAASSGAGYLAVSPVFATPTKPDAGPCVGIDGIQAIRKVTDLPLVAIGGIDKDNISLVLAAGADMICAISASLAGGKVAENIRELMSFNNTTLGSL